MFTMVELLQKIMKKMCVCVCVCVCVCMCVCVRVCCVCVCVVCCLCGGVCGVCGVCVCVWPFAGESRKRSEQNNYQQVETSCATS